VPPGVVETYRNFRNRSFRPSRDLYGRLRPRVTYRWRPRDRRKCRHISRTATAQTDFPRRAPDGTKTDVRDRDFCTRARVYLFRVLHGPIIIIIIIIYY